MITSVQECRDFSRLLSEARKNNDRQRVDAAWGAVADLVRKGEVKMEALSIRTMFEQLVPNGDKVLRERELNRRAGMRQNVVMEAGDAVNTADFSNLIGQIEYGSVMQAMELPQLIGSQLVTVKSAMTQGVEQVPGVTMLTDNVTEVGEAEDYPRVGIGEQWIVAPRKPKTGFVIEVTEEIIDEDRTSLVAQQINRGGEVLAINREREILSTVVGNTTNFRYKDNAAQATYANSFTGFTLDNLLASNAFVDYTSLDAVENAFDAVVDPGTGEPVSIVGGMQILHPRALRGSVFRTLNATETRQGQIDATTPVTISANPLSSDFYNNYSALSNQYVKEATGSDSTYFVGKFNEAFEEHEKWPLQVFVEDQGNHGPRFERDIVTRIKARRKAVTAVVAPWKVMKVTA